MNSVKNQKLNPILNIYQTLCSILILLCMFHSFFFLLENVILSIDKKVSKEFKQLHVAKIQP